jgi:hypothetical protein
VAVEVVYYPATISSIDFVVAAIARSAVDTAALYGRELNALLLVHERLPMKAEQFTRRASRSSQRRFFLASRSKSPCAQRASPARSGRVIGLHCATSVTPLR